MARKTKYAIVRIFSFISGTSKVWIRLKEAPEVKLLMYDPAVGKKVLFIEGEHVKGKDHFPAMVKKRYNLL